MRSKNDEENAERKTKRNREKEKKKNRKNEEKNKKSAFCKWRGFAPATSWWQSAQLGTEMCYLVLKLSVLSHLFTTSALRKKKT
jgi:hypothetical protein